MKFNELVEIFNALNNTNLTINSIDKEALIQMEYFCDKNDIPFPQE